MIDTPFNSPKGIWQRLFFPMLKQAYIAGWERAWDDSDRRHGEGKYEA